MKRVAETYDVIVIGGGAAGLMAAGTAAGRGRSVLLLEKNAKLGEKLAISGGGRCNILNAEDDERKLLSQFGKAEPFLYSPFSRFGMQETYRFFESRGLPLIVEARKRAFPASKRSLDVIETLRTYLKSGAVRVKLRTPVTRIERKGSRIEYIEAGGEVYTAESYILATGGVSHPETGSTGDGFSWLGKLGHTVVAPTPTIVPLKASDPWIPQVAGVTIPLMKITFAAEGMKKFSAKGPLLFTHQGISGPTVLNAAGKVADLLYAGQVLAAIDMFPDTDVGTLDQSLLALLEANKNKALKNVFKQFVPPGMSDVLLTLLEADPDQKVNAVTKEMRRQLVELAKNLPLTITGLMGFEKAVVADGGVPLTELDMKTLRSAKLENLFIVGDLLHISRPSGGYSLQLCWTTGYVAGANA